MYITINEIIIWELCIYICIICGKMVMQTRNHGNIMENLHHGLYNQLSNQRNRLVCLEMGCLTTPKWRHHFDQLENDDQLVGH